MTSFAFTLVWNVLICIAKAEQCEKKLVCLKGLFVFFKRPHWVYNVLPLTHKRFKFSSSSPMSSCHANRRASIWETAVGVLLFDVVHPFHSWSYSWNLSPHFRFQLIGAGIEFQPEGAHGKWDKLKRNPAWATSCTACGIGEFGDSPYFWNGINGGLILYHTKHARESTLYTFFLSSKSMLMALENAVWHSHQVKERCTWLKVVSEVGLWLETGAACAANLWVQQSPAMQTTILDRETWFKTCELGKPFNLFCLYIC